jgi:hypothetical protein
LTSVSDASSSPAKRTKRGKQLLERIVAMLIKLCRALREN